MNIKITIILLLTLEILSCSSSFITKTKNKTIKLNSLPENILKVGIENDLVVIKFNRNDLIELFENDIDDFYDQRIKTEIDRLKSLETDTIFNEKKLKGTLPFSEYELKFYVLLKKGNAEIKSKKENQKLEKIKYKFTRDKFGGENATFYKENGTEIYEILLAFGE